MNFITDFGAQIPLTDESGAVAITLPRYAVWGQNDRGKAIVLEVGNDRSLLQARYLVPDQHVIERRLR
jgi:hypothetical protein